jgi:hypothetical protein
MSNEQHSVFNCRGLCFRFLLSKKEPSSSLLSADALAGREDSINWDERFPAFDETVAVDSMRHNLNSKNF